MIFIRIRLVVQQSTTWGLRRASLGTSRPSAGGLISNSEIDNAISPRTFARRRSEFFAVPYGASDSASQRQDHQQTALKKAVNEGGCCRWHRLTHHYPITARDDISAVPSPPRHRKPEQASAR